MHSILKSSCHLLGNIAYQRKDGLIVAACKIALPQERTAIRMAQSDAVRDLLDQLLGKLLPGESLTSRHLKKNIHGKPFFEGSNAPVVSLSHSGNWVACALATDREFLGIDIESLKPRAWEEIDIFHTWELNWIRSSTPDRNIRELACWCLKEAAFKSIGMLTTGWKEIAFAANGNPISLPPEFGDINQWKSEHWILDDAVLAVVWKISENLT